MQYVHGTTSLIIFIRALDTTSVIGAGKTGLAWNTATLAASYVRNKAAAVVDITPATMTLGTWASGGFVQVDAAKQPGLYAFGVPDAALATGDGSTEVVIQLRGISGAVFPPVQIDLTTGAAGLTDEEHAKVMLIGSENATVLTAQAQSDTLTIYASQTYSAALGNSIVFYGSWPAVAWDTIKLHIRQNSALLSTPDLLVIDGTFTDAATDFVTLDDITSAQTATLVDEGRSYTYQLVAIEDAENPDAIFIMAAGVVNVISQKWLPA
jgi:hypothetical protein